MSCWMPPAATVWSAGARRCWSGPTRRWSGRRPSRARSGPRRTPSTTAPIRAAASGEYRRRLPEKWKISCGEEEDKLTLIVSPTGFKHTGVFPEQAVNWAWYAQKIRAAGRPVKVLNLFGYTGGATLACAAAGATVCHVDASKGIVAWGKDNAAASGLADRPIRWLVDDCAKFVAREKRRGNTYDGIIMDPPSYGRGPGGEIWKLEDCIYDLISQCEEVLSDTPLFFAVNSYTTGLSPAVMEYMLKTTLVPPLRRQDQLRRDRSARLRHRRRRALRRDRDLGRVKAFSRLSSVQPLRQCFALPPPLVGEALAVLAKFPVSPEAPLLGELASGSETERLYKDESFGENYHLIVRGTAFWEGAPPERENTNERNDPDSE